MRFLMDYMRHHKRLFMVFILVFIGIPFCMWTVPGSKGSGAPQADDVLGQVGSEVIRVSDFRRALDSVLEQKNSSGRQRATYEDLVQDGTADRVWNQLIDRAHLRLQDDARRFDVENELAIAQMKKWPRFQTEDGKFVGAAWNRWVERDDVDWNSLYADVKSGISQEVYFAMVTAPAGRVLDQTVEDELEANHTQLTVKLAAVAPPVEPEEEALQAWYDEHQEDYREGSKYTVDYIALSLLPEIPEVTQELLAKTQPDTDWAVLAEEYAAEQVTHRALDWMPVPDEPVGPQAALFALSPGEVSKPVQTASGVTLYRLIEDRTDDTTGMREIRAEQLFVSARLPEEARQERQTQADTLLLKAQSEGLEAAAQEASLDILSAGPFSKKDVRIEGIPQSDSYQLRNAVDTRVDDAEYVLAPGVENLYVVKVVSAEQGAIPPLEEVRDRVRGDVVAAEKQTEEYQAKVEDYCAKLAGETGTLEEIAARYPELALEVKTSEPFSHRDYNVLSKIQCYVNPADIYEAFKDKEAGALASPLHDFFGGAYVVQLAEKTIPTEEERAGWDEERTQIRTQMAMMAKNAYLADYVRDLRERMKGRVKWGYDEEKMAKVLGVDLSKAEEAPPAE